MNEVERAVNETAEAYKGKTEVDLKIMLCDFALKVIGITAAKITEGINTPNAH
jgi:hypothetical protein